MNRILRRPMFRLGGSTEGQGIMTGVKRPGYKTGIGPNVMDSESQRAQDFEQRFKTYQDIYSKYAPTTRSTMGPGTLPGFLTGFGLDLLSRPSTGNIFQTAAQSAQQPFQAFQSARGQEQAEERALNRAILGDVIEAESKEEQSRLEGQGQTYAKKQAVQGLEAIYNQQIDEIKSKYKEGQPISAEDAAKIKQLELDKKEDAISIYTGGDTKKERIQALVLEAFKQGEIEFEVVKKLYPEVAALIDAQGQKEGGRIGYEIGGNVGVETPMMNQTSAPVIAMDYTTLRARLPKQVGDDIVKLLTESEEALTDFANIRTQEDVDQFNQAYKVNLVLPQEV